MSSGAGETGLEDVVGIVVVVGAVGVGMFVLE